LLGISKLARSVEVNSDGKVIVRYYSPLRWPARYAEFIQKERARYTPNQRRWFSFFYRGKNWLEAIFFLLLGLLIGGAGVFLVFMEPGSIFSPYPAGLLVVGVLLIAYAWRSFRTVDKGNPFNINND